MSLFFSAFRRRFVGESKDSISEIGQHTFVDCVMIREKIRKNTIKIKCKNRETMSTQEKFIIGSKEKEDLVILKYFF